MKILKLTLLILGIITFSGNSYSHGEAQTKSRCSWGWKYKAKVRVNSGPGIRSNSWKSCNKKLTDLRRSYDCVWQRARNINGWTSTSGAVTCQAWLHGRGTPNSNLFYDLSNKNEQTGEESGDVKYKNINFFDNKITIDSLDASLYAFGQDVFSSLQIQVWKPAHNLNQNIEDSIIDENEILWFGKITIINGEITLEGDFPLDSYEILEVENGFKIKIKNDQLTLNLTDKINPEDEDIIVRVTSDGGYVERNISSIVEESNKINNFSFICYPNPIVNNVEISTNSNQNSSGSIKIYNNTGKLVHTEQRNFKENETITLEFSKIIETNGIYYILISIGEKKHVEKIIY